MRWKVAVFVGLCAVVLLSATDWVMTFALLRAHPGAVESNPVAAAFLERYGWEGLALYKAGSVLAFVGAVALLTRRRPVVATAVVAVGCAILIGVVTYSHGLLLQAHAEQRQLEKLGFPKPGEGEEAPFNGLPIPEKCVFASAPPVKTASRR